jgi:tetratricopeptide (TPR) repeat protein
MRKNFWCLFIFMLVTSATLYAQDQDAALAGQYLQQGDFDKAVSIYEKLYEKNNDLYYSSYLQCLIELKNFSDAERLVKKQLHRTPDRLSMYVDLGTIYSAENKTRDATDAYETAIRQLKPSPSQISSLANYFDSHSLTDYAIETYEKGRELLHSNQSDIFYEELATLYQKKNDPQKVVGFYLDILQMDGGREAYVEGELQSLMDDNNYSKALTTELFHRIQKSPDDDELSDLLIWYYVQKKDFPSAFSQVKALDRKNREQGDRVFQLGQIALQNGNYDDAINCFKYIVDDKGKNGTYYQSAKSNILSTQRTKILVTNNYTTADLQSLAAQYEAYLNEFGKNSSTVGIMRDYASLEAYYIHDLDKASALLNEALNLNVADQQVAGQLKLDLGDVDLISNKPWDAMLLYSQVDKAYRDASIGEQARFKNALLSYHLGQFDWSTAQLDVLKGSTSQLVANDALALSVFLTDKMGLDSTPEPMKMYARADLLIFQHKYDEAISTLDSLATKFPNHALHTDALFQKGRIFLAERKYDEAAQMFVKVDSLYPKDLLADLYEHQLNDKEKAMEYYKQLITNYQGSLYVIEARKRFRSLRGDTQAN